MGVRANPFRVAGGTVTAGPWLSADNAVPIGEYLPSWDYGTIARLRRVIEVDLSSLLSECGLAPDTNLALNVRYWPTTSLIRRTALHRRIRGSMIGSGSETIEIEIPGADLAASLVIETSVVLAGEPPIGGEPFVARRPGSILWRDENSFRLEGTAGLLPVAPVSFRDQGLPEQAAWYVSVDSADWSSAAMGNLLVLLNEDNPAVRRALEAPLEAEAALLLDALTVDVLCDLIGRALMDEEFPLHAPPSTRQSEATMAALVHSWISGFLGMPGETAEAAVNRLRDEWQRDPSRVRAIAQSGLRFPGSRTA